MVRDEFNLDLVSPAVAVQVRMTPAMKEQIETIAADQNITVSEVVSLILETFLDEHSAESN